MTITVFLLTLLLLAVSGWVAAIFITLGFGPLFVRLIYLFIGIKSISFIPNEITYKTSFYLITLLIAFVFFNAAIKKIKNGTAMSRTIPDVKWSMMFFVLGTTFGFFAFLFNFFF